MSPPVGILPPPAHHSGHALLTPSTAAFPQPIPILHYNGKVYIQPPVLPPLSRMNFFSHLIIPILSLNPCHFLLFLYSYHYLGYIMHLFMLYTFDSPRKELANARCMLRRDFSLKPIFAAAGTSVPLASHPLGSSSRPPERLPYKPEGYSFWTWRGHKIHYVVQGEGTSIVLIHGFGASAFHWRYNIPELAKTYKVYAIDLLGFGWSDKAIIDYDAMIWRDQVVDFLKEIVKEPAVLVGNSLGGFIALATAGDLPEQVIGVALLNSAGQFGNPDSASSNVKYETTLQKSVLKPLKEIFQRIALGFLFWQAKQPARIESVLKSVYIDSSNVDDYLIQSIIKPAEDPNAGEVYYRLMTRFMSNQKQYTLDSILSKLSCPLLLVWGERDPWVGVSKARRIEEFYPNTSLVSLQAGHCPHDEAPESVNKALIGWLSSLTPHSSDLPLHS